MTSADTGLFQRLEWFYDALPRTSARAEDIGGLVLFVREGAGWPFYARPRPDVDGTPSAADITAARARQRDLGVPEAFEWVHENSPDLLAVARSAGLAVLEAPLMVLDPSALPPASELSDVSVRLLDPHAPSFADDVAVVRAVAEVGFGTPGTDSGEPGPAERDAAVVALDEAEATEERRKAVSKQRITALAETAGDGALASGVGMRTGDVVEIAGVATLPTARRKGLGAAVTAAIARRALDDGADVVFLAAGSEDIARVYVRVGFRRIGTACIAEPAPVPA